jgi:dTDP-4-dehydrorhamnose reductase|tara:strand:- start:1701 stop:2018 length:318 start_codon:yes stop_codon:yes gene_type:complete
MDIGSLKKQSDLSYDIAIAKRNALEKAHSRQIIVYNEHIFCADPQTICVVSTLKETNETFFMLDTNGNPVEIKDPADFLSKLIERNQESLNSYHQVYKTFEKKGD